MWTWGQIDTGTDLMHPDIQGNLWINPGESKGKGANASNGFQNGIDDDDNGAIRYSPDNFTCHL